MSPALLNVQALAEHLETSINTVWSWKRRGKLPEPVQYFGKSPLWKASQFKSWSPPSERKEGK